MQDKAGTAKLDANRANGTISMPDAKRAYTAISA